MLERDVVLVADRRSGTTPPTLESVDFELVEDEYFDEVVTALQAVSRSVTHYTSPVDFIDNIAKHADDIVVPLWAGQRSRNRKSLLPSICEAYNLVYVGADSHTNVISQDKALAKTLSAEFGFNTPRGVLIRSEGELGRLRELSYPAVVKPNFEGGSIGISRDCLVLDLTSAKEMAARVLHAHLQPVLVEEFVPGREVSVVISGSASAEFTEAVELHVGSTPLRNTIWSYELKQADEPINWSLVTSDLNASDLRRAADLFGSFEKAELLRIDGRLHGKKFVVLELSPDVHLGITGSVAEAFRLTGTDYADMFERLLRNALTNNGRLHRRTRH